MRKIALGLVVLVSLLCVEALEFTQEEIEDIDEQCKNGGGMHCTALGECYLSGTDGPSKDYKKAKFYLEKVCKKGNEKDERFLEACTNLGVLYEDGGYHSPNNQTKSHQKHSVKYTIAR